MNARAYALRRAILTTAAADELLPSNPLAREGGLQPLTKKDLRPATVAELDVLVNETPDHPGALAIGATAGVAYDDLDTHVISP